jgi:short-subunit dehydrogenase
MKIAIITGASSGLGHRFAALADQEGLDCLWLIARRQQRLAQLAARLQTPARILALDLTQESSLQEIAQQLQQAAPTVTWLVNAAGFGRLGSTTDLEAATIMRMIDLDCRAPAALIQLCLPYMAAGSHILNIASVAGFQPLPQLNAYAASKAFLLRYSQALSFELHAQKITVTALCPYWIKDTEFIGLAQGPTAPPIHFPLASSAAYVVKKAWSGAKQGQTIITPGLAAHLTHLLAALLPARWMMSLSGLWRKL